MSPYRAHRYPSHDSVKSDQHAVGLYRGAAKGPLLTTNQIAADFEIAHPCARFKLSLELKRYKHETSVTPNPPAEPLPCSRQ